MIKADLSVLLVLAVWTAVTISQVVRSLAVPKTYTPITSGPEAIPAWADRVETLCDALVLLACAVVVLMGWRRGARPQQVWLLAVLLSPWAVLVGHQVLSGGEVGPGVLPYPALVLAFWLVRPRFGVVELVGYLTAVGAVLAILLALAAPTVGLYTGGPGYLAEKPIGPWGILAGFLPTGNNMGRFLAIGLPSVLVIRNGLHRWSAVAITVVALIWTASRTSVAGVAVLLVAVIALRLLTDRKARSVVAAAGLGASALVVVVLPFVVTAPHQFNHRAGFWIFLLDRWREAPWLGQRMDYFERLATQPDNLGGYAYHAHNLAVQVLVTGGLVTALAVAGVLGYAAVRAVRLARGGVEWPVLLLAVMLTAAVLEVPVSFADNIKANLPALLPLLVLLLARVLVGPEAEPADEQADDAPHASTAAGKPG